MPSPIDKDADKGVGVFLLCTGDAARLGGGIGDVALKRTARPAPAPNSACELDRDSDPRRGDSRRPPDTLDALCKPTRRAPRASAALARASAARLAAALLDAPDEPGEGATPPPPATEDVDVVAGRAPDAVADDLEPKMTEPTESRG